MLIQGDPPGTVEKVYWDLYSSGCEQKVLDPGYFQENLRVKVTGPQKWALVIRARASATPTGIKKRSRAAIKGAPTGQLPGEGRSYVGCGYRTSTAIKCRWCLIRTKHTNGGDGREIA